MLLATFRERVITSPHLRDKSPDIYGEIRVIYGFPISTVDHSGAPDGTAVDLG